MITGALKSKVDAIWNTMWSGGISNPLSVIEQLTYLLFIKRLDEVHTLKEAARPPAPASQSRTRYSPSSRTSSDGRASRRPRPEPMLETVRDEVFPFIKTLGKQGEPDGTGGSTYSHHMEDARFDMPSPRVLANVVDQLDDVDMADSDTKGDLYEYMLGKIATSGQNGQFRTPRHIIRLMVGHDRPHAQGRDLRPGLRHGWFPRWRVPSTWWSTTATPSTRTPRRAATITRARSTATTSTTPCCASAV